MKCFNLIRLEDESGVSGEGVVAEGIVFTAGHVVITWLSDVHSVTYYKSQEDMESIHGHDGRTQIVWRNFQAKKEKG